MATTVTVPGSNNSSTTVSLSFVGTANVHLANQIANALFTASANSTLDVVSDYAGGAVPAPPLGTTIEELILSPAVTGSITVPPAASGVTEVLVLQNTGPVTIQGSSNLSIMGGGPGSVDIPDPNVIDVGASIGATGSVAVTVTAADSPYMVDMGPGFETVTALGTGTINSGTGTDLIDLTGSSGSNLVVVNTGTGGDTVFAGSGSTTIQYISAVSNSLLVGGSGTLDVEGVVGSGDTISAPSGLTGNITLTGSNASVVGGPGTLAVSVGGSGNFGNFISTGASNATVTIGGFLTSHTSLVGGSGTLGVTDNDANDTIFAGSGPTTVDNGASASDALDIGGAGNLYVQDAGSADTIAAGLGNASVSTAGSDAVVLGGGGSMYVDAGGGTGDTVAFGFDGGTFTSSSVSSGALVFAGGGAVSVNASNTTNDTIVGASGALTVNAGSATGLLVFGPGSGSGMDFIGGPSSATVVAGAGTDTVAGGSGALELIAGPNETLGATGGGAGTTLFGSANSDVNFSASAGALTYVAGSGNETLNASGSSVNGNVVWGGADSTAGNLLNGGSGNELLVAGIGADTFTAGGGNNEFIFLNSIMSLLGGAAQHDVINNFLTGSNQVDLFGLSVSGTPVSSGGNTTVTLSDNTTIEFLGVSSYSQISGRIFTG